MNTKASGESRKKTPFFFTSLFSFCSILFVIIISISLFLIGLSIPTSQAVSEDPLQLEENDIDADLPEEFVRGYFNEISFDSADENVHVEISHLENEQTYSWTYDGRWGGDYLDYLDEENTTYENNRWSISIAIHGEEEEGEWDLYIETDGETHSYQLDVVSPSAPLTVSGGVEFYLEPYEADVYSDKDAITYTNNGNVKTRVVVEYEEENLTHQIERDVFEPGESGEITFQYYSADGGVISFGTEVSVQHYPLGQLDLDSEDNIGVGSRETYLLNVGVTVGYENYEQVQMENYEVQYSEKLSVEGNTENDLTFYVYPHEEIDFDVIGSDIDILDVSEDTNDPLVPDEEDREIELTVQFRSHHENDGRVELILDGDNYTTEIQLTETAPEPGDEEVSFMEEEAETITLGIILVAILVLIGGGRVWLSKRKSDRD